MSTESFRSLERCEPRQGSASESRRPFSDRALAHRGRRGGDSTQSSRQSRARREQSRLRVHEGSTSDLVRCCRLRFPRSACDGPGRPGSGQRRLSARELTKASPSSRACLSSLPTITPPDPPFPHYPKPTRLSNLIMPQAPFSLQSYLGEWVCARLVGVGEDDWGGASRWLVGADLPPPSPPPPRPSGSTALYAANTLPTLTSELPLGVGQSCSSLLAS